MLCVQCTIKTDKMKANPANRLRAYQKLTQHRILWVTSIALISIGGLLVTFHLSNPDKAKAASCESEYVLDWSNASTFNVTCGTVNPDHWSVKGQTCVFTSPLLNSGGTSGNPDKEAQITVRINQTGNLDLNDTAWVNLYINGSAMNIFRCTGDSISSVFTMMQTVMIPAGSTYQLEIILKNDKMNETWQIKDGDVSVCLNSAGGQSVTLTGFTGVAESPEKVVLNWSTLQEVHNSHFTIEHSLTGMAYTEIGTVPGAGNTSGITNYSFTDNHPYPGTNHYRLKQTDLDGNTTLFSNIKVRIGSEMAAKPVSIFPNPFTRTFTLKYHSTSDQHIRLRLIGIKGVECFEHVTVVSKGENNITYNLPGDINPGNYIVKVEGDDGSTAMIKAISN